MISLSLGRLYSTNLTILQWFACGIIYSECLIDTVFQLVVKLSVAQSWVIVIFPTTFSPVFLAPHVEAMDPSDPSGQELKGLAAKMALPEQEVDHLDVQFRHYDFDGSGALDLEVPPLGDGRGVYSDGFSLSAWGVKGSLSVSWLVKIHNIHVSFIYYNVYIYI